MAVEGRPAGLRKHRWAADPRRFPPGASAAARAAATGGALLAVAAVPGMTRTAFPPVPLSAGGRWPPARAGWPLALGAATAAATTGSAPAALFGPGLPAANAQPPEAERRSASGLGKSGVSPAGRPGTPKDRSQDAVCPPPGGRQAKTPSSARRRKSDFGERPSREEVARAVASLQREAAALARAAADETPPSAGSDGKLAARCHELFLAFCTLACARLEDVYLRNPALCGDGILAVAQPRARLLRLRRKARPERLCQMFADPRTVARLLRALHTADSALMMAHVLSAPPFTKLVREFRDTIECIYGGGRRLSGGRRSSGGRRPSGGLSGGRRESGGRRDSQENGGRRDSQENGGRRDSHESGGSRNSGGRRDSRDSCGRRDSRDSCPSDRRDSCDSSGRWDSRESVGSFSCFQAFTDGNGGEGDTEPEINQDTRLAVLEIATRTPGKVYLFADAAALYGDCFHFEVGAGVRFTAEQLLSAACSSHAAGGVAGSRGVGKLAVGKPEKIATDAAGNLCYLLFSFGEEGQKVVKDGLKRVRQPQAKCAVM